MLWTLTVNALVMALAAAASSPSPELVLARMRQAQAEVTTLTARLDQVKSFPQLGIDDPAESGELVVARSEEGTTRVRIEIREPERRVLIVSNGYYLLYQPRIQQAVEGRLSDAGNQALFSKILTGSPDAHELLEREYQLEGLGEKTFPEADAVGLRFVARPDASVYCHSIDVWVDTASWLPVQQSCHEANESVITLTLHDVKLNVPIDSDVFEIDLPPGVEKVRG